MLRVDRGEVQGICLPMQHESSSEAESEEQVPIAESAEAEVMDPDVSGESSDGGEEVPDEGQSEVEPTPEEQIADWRERAIRASVFFLPCKQPAKEVPCREAAMASIVRLLAGD